MTKAETTGAAAPSGAATYDSSAQAAHWLVAALAVITIPLGWAIAGAPRNTPQRDLLLLLHRFAGLAISCGDDISHRVALASPAATVAACSRPVGNRSRPHHALCPLPVPYLDSACRIFERRRSGPRGRFFRGRLDPAAAVRERPSVAGGDCEPPRRAIPAIFIHPAAHRGCAVPRHHQSDGIVERMLPIRRAG